MKISVIVPVYNSERYLSQCVESILSQTYSDFELLLINDGSKDKSESICDEFSKKDKRIRVFHQKNSGVSAARNKGINQAKGEYICFVDADDWVDQNIFEFLINTIESVKGDLSYCGHIEYNNKFNVKKEIQQTHQKGYGYEVINNVISSSFPTSIPIWTCIIKRKLIIDNNIKFTVTCSYGEDQEFLIKCLSHSIRVSSISKYLYYYRVDIDSAMSSKKLNQFDFPFAMVRVKKYLKDNNQVANIDIEKFQNFKISSSLILVINILSNSNIKIRDILDIIKQNDLNKYIQKKNRKSGPKWKLSFIWYLSPYLYIYTKRIYWKIRSFFN